MEQSGHPPPSYQPLQSPGQAQPARFSPIVAPPRPMFGRDPMQTLCGNCNQLVITSVETENGACTYIAAVIVFLICFPFFWVPLVIDSCRDYRHICPACKAVLGVFKKV